MAGVAEKRRYESSVDNGEGFRGIQGDGCAPQSQCSSKAPMQVSSPASRPNPSTLDLTIALLTGIIVMGVSV